MLVRNKTGTIDDFLGCSSFVPAQNKYFYGTKNVGGEKLHGKVENAPGDSFCIMIETTLRRTFDTLLGKGGKKTCKMNVPLVHPHIFWKERQPIAHDREGRSSAMNEE